jgi:NmrA-like family
MTAEPDAPKTVLVTGATGRLGVLVDLLLARGHDVRAMTRAPSSPRADSLRRLGAEVVYGDFDDPQSIRAAAAGADAMFATGTAHRAGPVGEERHGLNVAGAARDAGVGHLVYSSGDGAAPGLGSVPDRSRSTSRFSRSQSLTWRRLPYSRSITPTASSVAGSRSPQTNSRQAKRRGICHASPADTSERSSLRQTPWRPGSARCLPGSSAGTCRRDRSPAPGVRPAWVARLPDLAGVTATAA